MAVTCQFSLLLCCNCSVSSGAHSLIHFLSICFSRLVSLPWQPLSSSSTCCRLTARPPFSAELCQADCRRAMATNFSATPCSCASETTTSTCRTRSCRRRFTFARWPRRRRSKEALVACCCLLLMAQARLAFCLKDSKT